MTLTAAWTEIADGQPTLWMATDSRASDPEGVLIDEAVKLYELPVIAWRPSPNGFFDDPYFVSSVGMSCAGSTLVFQQVQATIAPLLSNLYGYGSVPKLDEIANLIGEVLTLYIRSRLSRRPREQGAELVIGGIDPESRQPEAYTFSMTNRDAEGRVVYTASRLNLGSGRVHFSGGSDGKEFARSRLSELFTEDSGNLVRAPLRVLRDAINNKDLPGVGGETQIGLTIGVNFRRMVSVTASSNGNGVVAKRSINNIDLSMISNVGPCNIGGMGMAIP